MPHKKGHWGYETRKNVQKTFSSIGKKYNPLSDDNKKIRKKENIIKSDKSTRQEKSVAKVQKAAIKRNRDNIKIADIHAKNKATIQKRAKDKNADWKKMRSGKMTREQFIKKYPNSNTAKKYGKKTGKRHIGKR